MQNNDSNELKVLVDISYKSAEVDEIHGAESDPLRTNIIEEEMQGKLLECKHSSAIARSWIFSSS
jgi:hypothetical protein